MYIEFDHDYFVLCMFQLESLKQIIDPTHPLLRWGPVPMSMFYMSEFYSAMTGDYLKRFPSHAWPNSVILCVNGQFLWLADLFEIRLAGKNVFIEYILPDASRTIIYTQWQKEVQALHAYQKKIEISDLKTLSDNNLQRLWTSFYDHIIAFWIPTLPAELGNFGSDYYLEQSLHAFVPIEEMVHVLEILTAPESPSFYQQEEIDLVETNDIISHQQHYYWLKNSYAGVEVLPVEFFKARKQELSRDLRKQMNDRFETVRQKKEAIISKYKLSTDVVAIARGLACAVEWQDERKKYIFQTLHYKDLLLQEIARRFGYDHRTLLNYEFNEITKGCFGKKWGPEYKERNHGSVVIYRKDMLEPPFEIHTLTETEVTTAWEWYTHESFEQDQQELKGIVACVGSGQAVTGKVKILLDPSQIDTFPEGSVLVTTMTTPEFVFAMKKSCAILTDTGGLTSHAAIVSRELKKPCIVGTKVATKILKDGDVVEVDANKGIIRKISP